MKKLSFIITLLIGLYITGHCFAQTGNITIIAGNGSGGTPVDGVAATTSPIQGLGIAVDAPGNVYVIDRCRLRKINAATGIITTVCGDGTAGFTGDGGPATAARIDCGGGTYPSQAGIWCDSAGDIFIADVGNNRIRKINAATAMITTVAGGGTGGDGTPATAAALSGPTAVTTDAAGNIYVICGSVLRKVTASTGLISTIPIGPVSTSGFGAYFTDVKLDTAGNIYLENIDFVKTNVQRLNVSSGSKDTLIGPSGSITPGQFIGIPGSLANFAAAAHYGMCLDRSGNLFIGDGVPEAIYRLDLSTRLAYEAHSEMSTTTGGVLYTATDTFGNIYFSNRVGYIKKLAPYKTILTTFYTDQNANCQFETTDNFMFLPVTAEVDSAGVPVDTITATSGFYYIPTGPVGTIYTIKILSYPPGVTLACPSSGIMRDTILAGKLYYTNNLGFNCSATSAFDLGIYTWTSAGQTGFRSSMLAYNLYCPPHTATVTMTGSTKYNYDATHPAATSISGNIAKWNYTGLSVSPVIPTWMSTQMVTPGSSILTVGDTAQTQFNITPLIGDVDTTNNAIAVVDTIRAGYDPNNIQVHPEGCILPGTELQYTIHFENTGNDTAHNIVVADLLPDELDIHTLKVVASSAAMNLMKYKSGTHNMLKFEFPNINLPDSSHHGQNEGMFVFRIKAKTDMTSGITITNKAAIYFDINPAIWTNDAINTKNLMCGPDGIAPLTKDQRVHLYPNPATHQLTIKTEGHTYTSLTICNSIGQEMMGHTINNQQTVLNVQMLPPGVYYVTLKGDDDVQTLKFVKM